MTTAGRPRGGNRTVLRLLGSPVHALLSGRVCELAYTGAVTGARHALPVEYAQDRDRVVVMAAHASTKRWWRNFTGVGRGATVTIRRHPYDAHAMVLAPGGPGYDDALTVYRRRHRAPQDADHRLVMIRLLRV